MIELLSYSLKKDDLNQDNRDFSTKVKTEKPTKKEEYEKN